MHITQEAVSQDDRAWFSDHPEVEYMIRALVPGEYELDPGDNNVVLVRNFPGVGRTRTSCTIDHPPPCRIAVRFDGARIFPF